MRAQSLASFAFCGTGTSASNLVRPIHGKRRSRVSRAVCAAAQPLESRVLLSASIIKEIDPGSFNTQIQNPVTIGNELYFAANDGVHGEELWKSDGTTAGTVMVADINPGSGSSNPANLTSLNGELYFTASDGVHGTELWKSDGTAAGTSMVADLNPGAASSNPSDLTAEPLSYINGGVLYFLATDTSGSTQIWYLQTWDNSVRQLTTNLTNISDLTNVDGMLYFAADDGVHGTELWNGDYAAAAKMVADINPGAGSSSPTNLTAFNNFVVFSADDGVHGRELWTSGGTPNTTWMIDDIDPGAASSDPSSLYAFEGEIYFTANGQLWKTNGGTLDTVQITVGNAFRQMTFTPLKYVSKGDTLFFANYDSQSDQTTLWQTDGTAAGTTPSAPNLPLLYENPQLLATESEVYFINVPDIGQNRIYQTSGNGGATLADPNEAESIFNPGLLLGAVNHTMLFSAADSHGMSLWGLPVPSAASATFVKTDTTTQGTWKGVYGSQGFEVPGNSMLPPGVQVSTENATAYSWADGINDPRALQEDLPRNPNTLRDADCWYAYSPFSLDVSLTDGGTHQVALYLLDYDRLGRSETVQISDATNGSVLSTQSVSNFQNGTWLVYNLSGDVKITFINIGPENAVVSGIFFDPTHTQAKGTGNFVNTNTTLGGNWVGTYGSGGYVVYGNGAVSLPADISYSEAGGTPYTWQQNTSDARALTTGPGSNGTVAGCIYSSSSFTVNLSFNDGAAHQLALYLLDWDNFGRVETIQLSDANTGATLNTRTVSNFQSGEYLVYDVSGNVRITITNAGPENAVLSGLFIDPGPASSSAYYVETDTSTFGAYTGIYGTDGYDVINGGVSLPSYVTLTPSSNVVPYTWSTNTQSFNALQVQPDSPSRIAACDYTSDPSFSYNLDLTDGQTHQVEIYLVDWDNQNRSETIQITDAKTGKLLDGESYSQFTNGYYGVWNLSGDVNITISRTGGLNAVVSGFFFDPVATTSSAKFVATDTTTQGTYTNIHGNQGRDIVNASESLPNYATLSFSQNATPYTWVANTTDPRALQVSPGSSSRIASCYYSNSPSFSFNLNLTGQQRHLVGLYFLDWDNLGRSETVQISSASTGAILDTETVSNFANGKYLLWGLSGDLNITITNTGGLNEVLSGIFFG